MLEVSSKGVWLRKRRISSLHAFSILAFGTSAGLDSQSFPFSSADPLSSSKSRATALLS